MTPIESKLVELYNQSPRLTYEEIAETLGLQYPQVTGLIQKLRKAGIIDRRTKAETGLKPTQKQLERAAKIKEYIILGLNLQEIGSEFGISKQAVHQFIHKYAPELLQDEVKREQLHMLYQNLIRLYNQFPRLTVRRIAEETGETYNTTICDIRRLRKYGLVKNRAGIRKVSLTEEQFKRLLYIDALRKKGFTWTEIGQKSGKSFHAVQEFYKRQKHHLNRD